MMNNTNQLIQERWIITGAWELQSAAHFGGGEGLHADMMILRNVDGDPFIPGASIAGLLRDLLRASLPLDENAQETNKKEPQQVINLFGGGEENQSRLIVNDAFLLHADDPDVKDLIENPFARRDGVALEYITRTAIDQAKYDFEILPAGLQFCLHMELIVWNDDNELHDECKKNLRQLLEYCQENNVRIGAKTSRGLGRIRIAVEPALTLYKVDYTSDSSKPSKSFLQWLWYNTNRNGDFNFSPDPSSNQYSDINELSADETKLIPQSVFQATLELQLHSSLNIRSYLEGEALPDSVSLTMKDLYQNPQKRSTYHLISGTSIAGPLRHRAEKLIQTLGNLPEQNYSTDNSTRLINSLFGFTNKKTSQGSRLIVDEANFLNNERQTTLDMVQNRNVIDRLAGNAASGCLFDEMPAWAKDENGTVTLHFQILEPEDWDIGLLLLLIKDIWTGWLTFGGESSIGRGVFMGKKAKLTYTQKQKDRESATASEWIIESTQETWPEINPDLPLTITNDTSQLEKYVEEFLQQLQEGEREQQSNGH